jgi:hypothetical protein
MVLLPLKAVNYLVPFFAKYGSMSPWAVVTFRESTNPLPPPSLLSMTLMSVSSIEPSVPIKPVQAVLTVPFIYKSTTREFHKAR